MRRDKKRELLFENLYRDIIDLGGNAATRLRDPGSMLDVEDKTLVRSYEILSRCLQSQEEVDALRYVIEKSCEWTLFRFFVTIDGDAVVAPDLTFALIDDETKESLAPRDDSYHDAFSFYVYGHREKKNEP